jgi:hypothetical protein
MTRGPMKRDEKFPIEHLSDEAWLRIEQRLFDPAVGQLRGLAPAPRPTSSTGRWLVLAAAALLLVAGLGARSLWRGEATHASRRLVAGELAVESLLGDATVRLEPGGVAQLHERAGDGARVVLERGAARFAVPPRKARPRFIVQAGEVRVEVVGTRFRVSRQGERVNVSDDEGKVRVVAFGKSVLLQPGMSWSYPPATSASSAPHVSTAAQPARAPSAPDPDPRATSAAPAAPLRRTKAPAEPDVRARFEQAARLEASDPERALEGYRSLAQGTGAWAETALYAEGRLLLERGQRARAVPLLRGYLRKYPRGGNAADVRSLLSRLGEPSELEPR